MRTYDITLENGKNTLTLGLRLTLAAQMAIKKKYNEETLTAVLSSLADVEKMVFILGQALNWKGNENVVTSGEELYDLLVDNGYAGQVDFYKLLTSLALFSGLVTEKQKTKLDAFAEGQIDKAVDEITDEEEDEKNAETSGR